MQRIRTAVFASGMVLLPGTPLARAAEQGPPSVGEFETVESSPSPTQEAVASPAADAPSPAADALSPVVDAPPSSQSPAKAAVAEVPRTEEESGDLRRWRAQAKRCDGGESVSCFGLGRTLLSAVIVEMEGARVNYQAATTERTGISGGWGVGVRLGVAFKDWVPLNVGVRHVSAHDTRPFKERVVWCMQSPGALPNCDGKVEDATTTAGGVMMSVETGIEPGFRLARALALSPGLLIGYAGTVSELNRSVHDCIDCRVVPLNIDASSAYAAASLRLTWLVFGLAARYERYLSGELSDAVSFSVEFGARYKALSIAKPAGAQ